MPAVVTYSERSFVASFKANPQIWSDFKAECRLRGAEICCVLEALMQAWIEGQRATATVVKPVVINLHMDHVVQRSRRKIFSGRKIQEPWEIARSKNWPPSCEHADDFIKATKEVGCLELKDHVSLEKCWRCYLRST